MSPLLDSSSPARSSWDELVPLMAAIAPGEQIRLSDALLELHSAWRRRDTDPSGLVETFLLNRRRLQRFDYLWAFRLRRRLEAGWQVRIVTPGSTQVFPLDLSWPSLHQVLSAARREVFEQGEADWSEIVAFIEPLD
ncbi:hypothetical protein [Roseibacillus ishigakijimensis]|uniref:Uncharacterized protein n=1 Tax=Roseibacillus ishigakijimensis TaxID=454146 RepID=A0A934RLP8_9BACT|nr:hypothetical protein [Roseibacillus ishigakijimensis]MBK1833080.1 hypothetical protein [Roseibacillus ishigakijimensis]